MKESTTVLRQQKIKLFNWLKNDSEVKTKQLFKRFIIQRQLKRAKE